MEELRLKDDHIKLGQALKAFNLVSTGAEAKIVIQDGQVMVNGQVDTARGRKLVPGDEITYNGTTVRIAK